MRSLKLYCLIVAIKKMARLQELKMVFYYCHACDLGALHHIRDKEFCETCKNMLCYRCPATQAKGTYNNYSRHAKACSVCPQRARAASVAGKAALQDAERRHQAKLAKQEPAATWLSSEERLRTETAVGFATFDIVIRSTSEQLTALHGGRKVRGGNLLLSDRNMRRMPDNIFGSSSTKRTLFFVILFSSV